MYLLILIKKYIEILIEKIIVVDIGNFFFFVVLFNFFPKNIFAKYI